MRSRSRLWCGPLALTIPLAIGLFARPAEAQGGFRPKPRREVYIELDDEGLRLLERAQRFEKAKEWALAVQIYDRLLTDPPFAGSLTKFKGGVIASLRSKVRDILSALPDEGQSAYRLLRRVSARKLWEAGDATSLRRILSRYPAAGYSSRAALHLALKALEEGRPGRAISLAKDALGRSGDELSEAARVRARRVWAYGEALLRRPDFAELVAKAVERSDAAAATSIRGALSKLSAAQPSRPANAAKPGQEPAPQSTLWAHHFPEFYASVAGRPYSFPLLVGRRVLFHNGSYAYALEADSGKLLWRQPLRPGEDYFRPATSPSRMVGNNRAVFLSASGKSVLALDAATGGELWRRSSISVDKEREVPLQLGSRLLHVQGLIIVPAVTQAEFHEYQLHALDAESGRVVWSTVLCSVRGAAQPGKPVLLAQGERIYVLNGDGVMACLEADDGSVRWIREYSRGAPISREPVMALTGTRLLVAPPDGNRIMALDAESGRELAALNDKKAPAIIGVYRNSFLRLYRNGQLRWGPKAKELIAQLPKGLSIVGRPLLQASRLLLPCRQGLAIVELGSGRLQIAKQAWTELGAPGQVLPLGERILAVADRGAVMLSPEPAAAAPKLAATLSPTALVKLLAAPRWARREVASQALRSMKKAARGALEEALKSADPEQAMRADELLFELSRGAKLTRWKKLIKEDWIKQIPDLLMRLSHRSSEVRLAALAALGAVEGGQIKALFRELLADEELRIRFTAARFLFDRYDRSGTSVLSEVLKTGFKRDRLSVLTLLDSKKSRGDRRKDLPLVLLALKDKDASIRAKAVLVAADYGDRLVLPELEPLVKDPDYKVRINVITALGQIGAARIGPILAGMVKDRNEAIRAAVVVALGRLETAEAAAALCEACFDTQIAIARAAAEQLHAMAKGTRSTLIPAAALKKALKAKDVQVRYWIFQVLKERAIRPVELLVILATDMELRKLQPGAHSEVLEELYNRATAADLEALLPLAKCADSAVRFAAVQIIGGLGGPRSGPAMLRLLEDEDEETANKAAAALAASCHPRTVLALLRRRVSAQAALVAAKAKAAATDAALTALIKQTGLSSTEDKPEDKLDPKLRAALGLARAARRGAVSELSRASRRSAAVERALEGMTGEIEAPGLILALADRELAIREEGLKELSRMVEGNKGFVPSAPEMTRAKGLERWRTWYLDFKTSKTRAELEKALLSENAKERISAAKNLREDWAPRTVRTILKALQQEKVPWVAAEFDKLLTDITGIASPLPKIPSAAAVKAAGLFWTKALAPKPTAGPKSEPSATPKASPKAPNKTGTKGF